MTFSIVANDADARVCGSAVASHSVAVGGTVMYSRVGVGVINSQHHAHVALGHRVLDEMEEGAAPHEALTGVLEADAEADTRQFAAIDLRGRQGAWTGRDCTDACRHVFGTGCVAAGNFLPAEEIIDRMVEAFEESAGAALGVRLMQALRAAESLGGDRRGTRAAGISVTPHRDSRTTEVLLDLRVDDHAAPIDELNRLHEKFRREFPR